MHNYGADVDCGALTRPTNGQVDTSSGTTYNLVAIHTAVTLAIILLVLQLEHVRLMEFGVPLHLSVNVNATFSTLYS